MIPTASRWPHWSAKIAIAVLVPLLILGIAEGALRVLGIGTPAGVTRLCRAQGHAAVCNNVFFTKPFFPNGMIRSPHPYAIPAAKPRGTFRIFVLGESAAYGDPDPAYGFSRYLEVMLRNRFPAMKFEVINTAATAINSYVVLPIAEDMAQHQPDLFIIYTGNNEVIGPFGPGTVLTSPALSLPVIRTSIFVRSTRIGQLLAKATSPKQDPQEWRGMEMFLDKQVRADSPLMTRAYANFAANLHDMVAVARSSGAKVLVSTVATNLKDCAPFASSHRPGLKPDALNSWTDLVQRGAQLQDSGSYAEALKLYLLAAEIDDSYAELQFRIATCLWNLGNFPAAKDHYVRAQDLDTLRFRADTEMNNIMRSVAAAGGSGVELVDAQRLFAEHSDHGIPGSELLYEHVHLNPRGNYLLAHVLFSRIAGMLPPEAQRSAAGDDVPSQAECERLLAFTPYDRSRLAGEILQRMFRPPFTNQLNQKQQVQRLTLEAQPPSDSYEETVEQYRWAIAQNPEDHMLHLNFGLLLYDRDRISATQEFRSARPYDDIPFVAPDGTLIR